MHMTAADWAELYHVPRSTTSTTYIRYVIVLRIIRCTKLKDITSCRTMQNGWSWLELISTNTFSEKLNQGNGVCFEKYSMWLSDITSCQTICEVGADFDWVLSNTSTICQLHQGNGTLFVFKIKSVYIVKWHLHPSHSCCGCSWLRWSGSTGTSSDSSIKVMVTLLMIKSM